MKVKINENNDRIKHTLLFNFLYSRQTFRFPKTIRKGGEKNMKVRKRLSNVYKEIFFNSECIELFIDDIFFVISTKNDDINDYYFQFTPFSFSIPQPFPVNYFIEIAKQIQELQ
jgi:hypothetical protein